jgi:hypothetical protein
MSANKPVRMPAPLWQVVERCSVELLGDSVRAVTEYLVDELAAPFVWSEHRHEARPFQAREAEALVNGLNATQAVHDFARRVFFVAANVGNITERVVHEREARRSWRDESTNCGVL